MSAIDIMVAAAARKSGSASQAGVPAGTEATAAASTVSFHRFDLVELTGRFQHEGWYPIPGDPLPGTATGLAEMVGDWQSIQFRLVSEADELIEEIALTSLAGGAQGPSFVGSFELPQQPFKVAVSGIDGEDSPFDVTWPTVYRPQLLEVRFDSPFGNFEPGPAVLSLKITNHGPADTFLLTAEDDMGVGVAITETELFLEQGATGTADVELVVPAISVGLLDITVSATASSNSDAGRSNSATTLVRTLRYNRVFDSGFEAPQSGGGSEP